ncbi:LOW QUALITY PROTEIN: uncharacterized mitochondrial protein AtMg01280-like [Arachis duranensis]|uniref:LOW QUALITY PROTEIN: uncharacterized mitochondrial protein AtMg01280-like n=1 Tax=Arachis duranensis TaxID=130453 RepID=A0A9C6TEL6_ARADU|nr:LOW QUALITY PROTEIN: uncharacterized mitochondrial protein AtMg01280-like [Arachis duranensis]
MPITGLLVPVLPVVYMIRICLASLFCYSLRVYLYSSIGFVFSDLVTVVIGASSVSGSGGKIIPHSSPATSSSEDSFGIQVLSEPWPVIHNETLESSMRNRIRVLENTDCIFLLDKEKGEYWEEVKRNLDSCPSQQEYNRVIEFESRDLQIRELRHNKCLSIFQQLLRDNPTLADRAIYNPQSAFVDLLDDNRTEIDEQVGSPLERDRREPQNQVD